MRAEETTVSKLRLSLACWNYDRVRALMDGSVQPEGIDLDFLDLPVEETFFRMLRHHEFDVAEMSLSSYTVSMFREPRPFVAIPVFPSRFFRHSSIYVNAGAGIREPKDLIGKRVGTPEYQMTAPVWIRGILADHYGVPVDSVTYCTGGEEEPGRDEKIALELPSNIRIRPIGPGQTLAEMLATGEIDALHTARMPSTFVAGNDRVKRLFDDYKAVEQRYFRDTGIFPIMHAIVIRRDVYEQNRWVAQALFKAFVEAQRRTYDDLYVTAALKAMLPWLTAHVEETRALMGNDYWSYGFARNRDTLATFLRYHHEQGLSKRLLTPEELFAPEAMESFKI
jgi:4,5-dihydroxyphthalate decarboxylase